jgi:hypothetical protein
MRQLNPCNLTGFLNVDCMTLRRGLLNARGQVEQLVLEVEAEDVQRKLRAVIDGIDESLTLEAEIRAVESMNK